jgi:hypothetical protein
MKLKMGMCGGRKGENKRKGMTASEDCEKIIKMKPSDRTNGY